MSTWKLQLAEPNLREYDPIHQHDPRGPDKTIMDLSPLMAAEVLRAAKYDPAAASGDKAPPLWGYCHGKVYRFMYDNAGRWHGYPVEEKPPNAVLQQWRQSGTLSEAEFGKIRRYANRGL